MIHRVVYWRSHFLIIICAATEFEKTNILMFIHRYSSSWLSWVVDFTLVSSVVLIFSRFFFFNSACTLQHQSAFAETFHEFVLKCLCIQWSDTQMVSSHTLIHTVKKRSRVTAIYIMYTYVMWRRGRRAKRVRAPVGRGSKIRAFSRR